MESIQCFHIFCADCGVRRGVGDGLGRMIDISKSAEFYWCMFHEKPASQCKCNHYYLQVLFSLHYYIVIQCIVMITFQ